MKLAIQTALMSDQQQAFLRDTHKIVGYGGARGGGKSWSVRTKAKLLCVKYPGIKLLIVRRSYPELVNNHILQLRGDLIGIAKYNDKDKRITFANGSTITFMYCARDADLDRLQGTEYDVIFLDEATQLSEYQIKSIMACLRGVNNYPKRIYLTMNPGGQGHGYCKRIFIDRRYDDGENPDDYSFIQALVTDNRALMQSQPDYIKQLEALPPKLRDAWLYGRWDVYEGQFFEDFQPDPPATKAAELDVTADELRRRRQWCHVIEPFAPPREWTVYRSYDWGYGKPFSCGWWAVDFEGRLYRILELYGCTSTPNEGVKWPVPKQMKEIARIEREHPWLAGREIHGVADPSIWDGSRGESVADTAMRYGVYFVPGVNDRIPGWMQVHYRLAFDEEGYPMMYIFRGCKAFLRTIPLLMYDENRPEDLDTDGEDHVADEVRYMCMARPIKPVLTVRDEPMLFDPLDQMKDQPEKRYGAITFRRA
jgi:phage terminase large subunit